MPTYEYRCTQCNHLFEQVQPVGDPAPACPVCGAPTRKVFSSVGLIFKGSGFHVTDYRKPAATDGDASKPSSEPAKPSGKESGPASPTASAKDP
jgi:putative FmdB family regulatory protein